MRKQFPSTPYSLPKPGLGEAPLDYSSLQEEEAPGMAEESSQRQDPESGPRARQGQGGVRSRQTTPGIARIRENGQSRARTTQGGSPERRRRLQEDANERAKRISGSTSTRYDPSNWGHIRAFYRTEWKRAIWNYVPPFIFFAATGVSAYLFIVHFLIPLWIHHDPITKFKNSYQPVTVVPVFPTSRPFRDESRPGPSWEDKSGGPMATVDKPWLETTPVAADTPETTPGNKARPKKATEDKAQPERTPRPTDDPQIYDILSLERRVTALEIGLERALKEKSQDLQKWNDNFHALSKSFENAKASTDGRLTELEKLGIGKKLNQIGDKLENAVKDIAELKEFRQTTDAAFARLYKDLPKKLPVRYNDKGKIQVMPEFWQDLTRWLKEQQYSKGSGKGAEGGTETVIIEKPAKWEDFLARNGKQLDAHVGSLQEKWHQRALHEQTLIPKEHHLELVKDLRDEYLKGVEEQFKEVHHELGAQLSSITNLRSMIESGEFGMVAGAGRPIGKFLADGLYSHHISKLADYASHAGGGFIDPDRTSETYEKHPPNTFANWAHWILGASSLTPKPGRVISSVARKPGNCWPFAGKTGSLGIILREPVYVTGMTLEHMEWERSLVRDTAPKSITFWVRIMEAEKYYNKAVMEASKALGERPGLVQAAKKSQPMYEYVKVGKFEYEFTESSPPAQTFWIPMDMKRLNISSDKVLMHVYDNHGNPNYTCIYRVRVHGEPLRVTPLPTAKKSGGGKSPVTGEDLVEGGDKPGLWEGLGNRQEL